MDVSDAAPSAPPSTIAAAPPASVAAAEGLPSPSAPPPAAPTFLDSILESIITPGAGSGLVLSVNISLAALLAVLLYFAVSGLADAHIATLAVLAVGLLCAFNWFIVALDAAKEKEKVKTP
jgi:hypothetical protein